MQLGFFCFFSYDTLAVWQPGAPTAAAQQL